MALYQNTVVDSDLLTLGNWKIQVATYDSAYTSYSSVASACDNLGAGILNSFTHTPTFYDVQAGNAPDPIEGIADEVCEATGELIELGVAKFASAWGGILTTATAITTTLAVLSAGGKTAQTPKTYLFTNRRVVNSASVETNIVIWKGYMKVGFAANFKSDNDADPITVYPFTIEGVIDGTRTAGNQLFAVYKWLD